MHICLIYTYFNRLKNLVFSVSKGLGTYYLRDYFVLMLLHIVFGYLVLPMLRLICVSTCSCQ
jgi:hypothetical protein